jgi:RNA polymerase sigma-32 factor
MSLQIADADLRSNKATTFALQERHKHRREGLPSPVSSALERLVKRIGGPASTVNQRGLLQQDQEQQLARRWHDLGDRAAIEILVISHLALAAKVARRYQRYGVPVADLISEANLGLVIAALRFKADRGSRFSTYALWWIKASIHNYVLRSWSLVRIGTTSAQKKLFFRLRREMRKFAKEGVSLTPQLAAVIAEELAVRPRDVIEMDRRLGGDLSLNVRASNEWGEEWQDRLVDQSPSPEALVVEHDEHAQRTEALHAALKVLTERERRVFVARRLTEHPPELEQLGRELSLSSERVRQIETGAFKKVKRAARRRLWFRKEP